MIKTIPKRRRTIPSMRPKAAVNQQISRLGCIPAKSLKKPRVKRAVPHPPPEYTSSRDPAKPSIPAIFFGKKRSIKEKKISTIPLVIRTILMNFSDFIFLPFFDSSRKPSVSLEAKRIPCLFHSPYSSYCRWAPPSANPSKNLIFRSGMPGSFL